MGKLGPLFRELGYGLGQHTNNLRGGGHGRREITGNALADLVEEIEKVGGTEALERANNAIVTGASIEENVNNLWSLAESLEE